MVNNLFATMPSEPQSIKEALKRPDSQRWKEAIQCEIDQLERNKTWEIVDIRDIPKGTKTVTGKWTFEIKRDGRYKARWVLKGYGQIKGLNYQETFAAVAHADSYRLLIALAALHDWEIDTIDIETKKGVYVRNDRITELLASIHKPAAPTYPEKPI